jgi:hypothetical protein
VSLTSAAPTDWWWNIGLNYEQLNASIAANGGALPVSLRPYADLEANERDGGAGGPLRYAAIGASYGDAEPTRWWYAGVSLAELGSLLGQNGAMPYSVAPDGLGVCSIMVPEQGGWWWLYDESAAAVGDTLGQTGSSLTWAWGHDGAMYATMNTPASQYWWFYGLALEDIGTQLEATGGMILSLDAQWDVNTNDVKFTMVLGPQDGRPWWWYYGLSEQDVNDNLAANNAYLTELAPYTTWQGPPAFGSYQTQIACVMRPF